MKAQIVERRRLVNRFFGICVVLLGLLVLWGCSAHEPTDPRVERSAESKNIPLLPMDVAVFGAATPAMDYSAKDVWFLSNEKGEYKVTDREQIYPPTFVRGVEDTFAIMQEGNLLLVNRNGETVASLPSGMDSWGMLRGTRSEDGRYVATLAYSDDADAALVLSDGQQAKAQPHPLEVGGMYISNDGTVFTATQTTKLDSSDRSNEFCIRWFSLGTEMESQCFSMAEGRNFSFAVVGLVDGEPWTLVYWYSDDDSGFSLYKFRDGTWEFDRELEGMKIDPRETGYIEREMYYRGSVYLLTDKPGIIRFAFPDGHTTSVNMDFQDLSDLMTGTMISSTVDNNIVSLIFYRDKNIVAGQYVSSFNVEDPSKRVGPWEIPPEVVDSGEPSVRAVYTLFITDEKTRSILGAE